MLTVFVNCTLLEKRIVPLPNYCPSPDKLSLITGSGCLTKELSPCTTGFTVRERQRQRQRETEREREGERDRERGGVVQYKYHSNDNMCNHSYRCNHDGDNLIIINDNNVIINIIIIMIGIIAKCRVEYWEVG